jgi:tRNA-dihydrouridine synthase 3
LEGKASEWALLKRHPEEDVFGVQLAAGHADQYTRACELIEAHTTVDFVDMNLGCPLDLICDKGAGAKLMLRDKKLKECVEGITAALSCPVTIKMRAGWNENKPFAHELVPKIQSWGIEGVAAIMVRVNCACRFTCLPSPCPLTQPLLFII